MPVLVTLNSQGTASHQSRTQSREPTQAVTPGVPGPGLTESVVRRRSASCRVTSRTRRIVEPLTQRPGFSTRRARKHGKDVVCENATIGAALKDLATRVL